jgi:hypothetical protein
MRILAKTQCLALSLLYVHHGGFVFVNAMPHAAERPERGLRLLLHARKKDTKNFLSPIALRATMEACEPR